MSSNLKLLHLPIGTKDHRIVPAGRLLSSLQSYCLLSGAALRSVLVAQGFYVGFWNLHRRRMHHLSGQAVPLCPVLREKFFPYILSQLFLFHLCLVLSWYISIKSPKLSPQQPPRSCWGIAVRCPSKYPFSWLNNSYPFKHTPQFSSTASLPTVPPTPSISWCLSSEPILVSWSLSCTGALNITIFRSRS